MTVNELLNEALREADSDSLSSNELTVFLSTYHLYLDDLLEERPWLFTFASTSNITPTEDGPDLGFDYKYRIPSDAIDVIGLNMEATPVFYSDKEALKMGYSPSRLGDNAPPGETNSFIYLGGILHSHEEITCVVYRRKVTPDVMKPSFRLLMVLTLAERFARTIGKDQILIDRLRSAKKTQHLRACRDNLKRPNDPYLAGIYEYIKEYYKSSRISY